MASVTSLGNSFAYDDVAIIANDWRIHRLLAPWQFFTREYWSHLALYRPLTSLAFAVEWSLGHGEPWVYHLVNVLLYLLTCFLVYRLVVRLLGEWPGWYASMLFAVHPVHVEAVGNVVGQSELWVAICILAAVEYYLSVRRQLRARDVVILSALYAAGCFFKEHAVVFPALLIAVELTIDHDEPWKALRWRQAGWLYGSLAIVLVAYAAVRHTAIGSFVGERPAPVLANLTIPERLITMLGVAPEWFRLLIAPIHLQADYMPQELPVARTLGIRQLGGLLLMLSIGVLAVVARRRRPVFTYGILWVAITLLPVSNLVIPTGILLAERTLFLPSVGMALGVASGITWLSQHLEVGSGARRFTMGSLAAVLIAGTVRSALRHPVWRNNSTFLAHLLMDAPRSYRAHWMQAHHLALRGDHAGVEREYTTALGLFPDDPRLLAELADRYTTTKRCSEAMPLYKRSLALSRDTLFSKTRFRSCLPVPPSSPP